MSDSTNAIESRQCGVTIGLGLRNALGERRGLPGHNRTVRALAKLLDSHDGEEAWCSLQLFEEGHRSKAAWRSCSGIALDADFHDKNGERTRPTRSFLDRLKSEHKDEPLPGNLFYWTPRGFRLLLVLQEPITYRDDAIRAHRGAFNQLHDWLDKHGLLVAEGKAGFEIDGCSLRLSQMFWAPRALVEGVKRKGKVHVLRLEPFNAEELIQAAPVRPAPRSGRTRSRGLTRFRRAAARYAEAHPIDWDDFNLCERECPMCGHKGCFGLVGTEPSWWACFSTSHERDSNGAGQHDQENDLWFGDALDIEAHRRSCTPTQVLIEDG